MKKAVLGEMRDDSFLQELWRRVGHPAPELHNMVSNATLAINRAN